MEVGGRGAVHCTENVAATEKEPTTGDNGQKVTIGNNGFPQSSTMFYFKSKIYANTAPPPLFMTYEYQN